MSKFPDWVLKHKIKGTHIISKNGNYYLYKVHSERRPGKTYPVLVTDEYLGTITENGLISKKQKINDIIVKEYGLSIYFKDLTLKLIPSIDNSSLVYIVLDLAYSKVTIETYNLSYISELYPNSFVNNLPSIESKMFLVKQKVDKNLNYDLLRQVYKVRINGNWFNSNISDLANEELKKYSIIME